MKAYVMYESGEHGAEDIENIESHIQGGLLVYAF